MKFDLSRYVDLRIVGTGIALLVLASCRNESTTVPSTPTAGIFIQVDRVGRPGVKEIFENFADHDSSNRNSPNVDPAIGSAITTYVQQTAGRSATIATNANTVFGIDELQLNLGASGNAGYLGVETNGGVGTNFGGRGLTDDAMGVDLNAAYGNLLGNDGANNPCLTTDNVGGTATSGSLSGTAIAAADGETSTFPYLGKPH